MTMGALHEGHATLIHQARKAHRHVVVTIFLNPLQFGPKEDLSRYPRTFDADLEICTAAGVDLVFAPTPDVVYPDGDPGVRVSAGPLGDVLEGQAAAGPLRRHAHGRRQAHAPDPAAARRTSGRRTPSSCCSSAACAVTSTSRSTVVAVPTVREPDGLAMSSRNTYLTPSDRETGAVPLGRAAGRRRRRRPRARRRSVAPPGAVLVREPLALVDYLVLVHPDTLEDVPEWYRGEALLAVAGRVGTTRLIDNLPVLVGPGGGALETFSQA